MNEGGEDSSEDRMSFDVDRTIRIQPGAPISQEEDWAPELGLGRDIPPDLEVLALVDEISIDQRQKQAEDVFGYVNEFDIVNGLGQRLLYAYEEDDFIARKYCGRQRRFLVHILDNSGREVMQVKRDYRTCGGVCCCCTVPGSCCAHEITIEAPPGNIIGTVSQRPSGYQIAKNNETVVLKIDRPGWCTIRCGCEDKIFTIKNLSNVEIGEIRRKWVDTLMVDITCPNNFGVKFSIDLSVRAKALIVGATFLIDFDHFEPTPQYGRHDHYNRPPWNN